MHDDSSVSSQRNTCCWIVFSHLPIRIIQSQPINQNQQNSAIKMRLIQFRTSSQPFRSHRITSHSLTMSHPNQFIHINYLHHLLEPSHVSRFFFYFDTAYLHFKKKKSHSASKRWKEKPLVLLLRFPSALDWKSAAIVSHFACLFTGNQLLSTRTHKNANVRCTHTKKTSLSAKTEQRYTEKSPKSNDESEDLANEDG